MKTIPESEMNFGKFAESDSQIYKKLGSGLKTVEFILKNNENSIIFLEAKKSVPNAANCYESKDKTEKFEKYYSSITEKFITSLQIYLSIILDIQQDNESEVGDGLKITNSLKDVGLKFILVVKNAKNDDWLAGPKAELDHRLIKIKKIWGIKIMVLNEELAKKYKLIC